MSLTKIPLLTQKIVKYTNYFFRHLSYGRNKKNFDEIDRTGFGRFVKRPMPVKKNFDEIDNVGFRSLYSF